MKIAGTYHRFIHWCARMFFGRVYLDPNPAPRKRATFPVIAPYVEKMNARARMIAWCHDFNVRNGWKIPARSARSIYLDAHRRDRA